MFIVLHKRIWQECKRKKNLFLYIAYTHKSVINTNILSPYVRNEYGIWNQCARMILAICCVDNKDVEIYLFFVISICYCFLLYSICFVFADMCFLLHVYFILNEQWLLQIFQFDIYILHCPTLISQLFNEIYFFLSFVHFWVNMS